MKTNKVLLYSVLSLFAAGCLLVGANYASARYGQNEDMATSLAAKLGVDQSKVETALAEVRTEHQAERQAEVSANLDKAVTDGVLTQAQKDALAKRMEENRSAETKKRGEVRQWAEDNGIDMSKLRDYGIGGRGQGQHGPDNN